VLIVVNNTRVIIVCALYHELLDRKGIRAVRTSASNLPQVAAKVIGWDTAWGTLRVQIYSAVLRLCSS